MAVTQGEITWIVTEACAEQVRECRDGMSDDDYLEDIKALRAFLCDYFSRERGCATKSSNISPMQSTAAGGKVLKVRWSRPGSGKRGGLRMGIVVFCDQKKVVLCSCALRRDADDDDLEDASAEADDYVE